MFLIVRASKNMKKNSKKNSNFVSHPINTPHGLSSFHIYFIQFLLSSSLVSTLRNIEQLESGLTNMV
jgi:hypothetical protein